MEYFTFERLPAETTVIAGSRRLQECPFADPTPLGPPSRLPQRKPLRTSIFATGIRSAGLDGPGTRLRTGQEDSDNTPARCEVQMTPAADRVPSGTPVPFLRPQPRVALRLTLGYENRAPAGALEPRKRETAASLRSSAPDRSRQARPQIPPVLRFSRPPVLPFSRFSGSPVLSPAQQGRAAVAACDRAGLPLRLASARIAP